MSLIFRMLALWVASIFKAPIPLDKIENTLTLRVLPNDLDINMHMNNGRYLTICDLNRVDMFLRTGMAKTMLKEKWMPIITEHTMTYKKALKLFQQYEVSMQVSAWDERSFFMKHTFTIGDRIIAEGTSVGVIRGRNGVIEPKKVLAKVKQYQL